MLTMYCIHTRQCAGSRSSGPWSIQKGKHADVLIPYSIAFKRSPNTTGILRSNGNFHTSWHRSVKCIHAILSSATNNFRILKCGSYFQTIWITLEATYGLTGVLHPPPSAVNQPHHPKPSPFLWLTLHTYRFWTSPPIWTACFNNFCGSDTSWT